MTTLEELTQEVEGLEPLPTAAARLIEILSAEDPDIEQAAAAIRFDQALTAGVLREANSAAWGARYRIHGVKDAVIRIGLPNVLQFAVRQHLQTTLRRPLEPYGLTRTGLWRHAAAAALGAEAILHWIPGSVPPLAFTAALLHDAGKLILARHLSPNLQTEIRTVISEREATYHEAELVVMGFSHATLGARMALKWNLGEDVAQAIEVHHELTEDSGPTADAVRISNLIAKTIGAGLGVEGLNMTGDPGACARLGITRDAFEGICADVANRLAGLEELAA